MRATWHIEGLGCTKRALRFGCTQRGMRVMLHTEVMRVRLHIERHKGYVAHRRA